MKDPRCPCDTEGQKLSWRGQRLRSRGEVGETHACRLLNLEPSPIKPCVVQNSVAVITKCFPTCLNEHQSKGATDKLLRSLCPKMT